MFMVQDRLEIIKFCKYIYQMKTWKWRQLLLLKKTVERRSATDVKCLKNTVFTVYFQYFKVNLFSVSCGCILIAPNKVVANNNRIICLFTTHEQFRHQILFYYVISNWHNDAVVGLVTIVIYQFELFSAQQCDLNWLFFKRKLINDHSSYR